MQTKEKVMEMYKDATERLDKALDQLQGTEEGSEARYLFVRIHGERQAYSRILKELHGVPGTELQDFLDEYHAQKRARW